MIFLRRCSGNTALYLRLLGRFADSHAGALADIDAAIAEGRHADAERHAHTLHGAAANLGAEALRLAARSLETALRNGQPWADARDRMARECEALGRALASVPPPPAAPAAADMPDAAAFDAILGSVRGTPGVRNAGLAFVGFGFVAFFISYAIRAWLRFGFGRKPNDEEAP